MRRKTQNSKTKAPVFDRCLRSFCYFFSSFSGGTRGCAACAAHSASRFSGAFRDHNGCAAACREQQNDRPEHDDAENERADRIDQTARAGLCRLRQLRAEAAALGGGGQSLHLIERDGKGREADQIVIMTLGAGQRVDLIFAVRERVFERNDVLHFARLIEQGEQTLVLGLERGEPGLDVGILLGDVLARTGGVDHMCAVAELRVKRLEFFLRNAQGVVGRAAALVAGKAARLDVAAGLGGQFFQISGGRVEILRLKR